MKNNMFHLHHGETFQVNDIWRYDVQVWKGQYEEVSEGWQDHNSYVMGKSCNFRSNNSGWSIKDSNFAASVNSGFQAETLDEDSTLVNIKYYGLGMNDERLFVPNARGVTGNLSYMDGGTNTTAVNPGRLGLPVINYVHFPKGMQQTLHTHPSQRIGLILSGSGQIELDNNEVFPINRGDVWVMERNVLHNFMCNKGEDVTLFVFAPDSGTGPTDEVNPLKVRTYVGQQRV
jgi:quercetin dioxygenase-like cupin family protein